MRRFLGSIIALLRNTSPNAEATHTEEEAYSFVRSDGAGNRCGQDGYVVVNANPKSRPLLGDNPISDHGDDVLERAGIADAFARQVLTLDASKGTTVGVFAVSHINAVVPDTEKWEQSAAYRLDTHGLVRSFVKNAGLGFAIPYLHNGEHHEYL